MSDQPDFIASFMEDYFAESEEHLAAVRRTLLMLEPAVGSGTPPASIVEELFRNFHSLKGISAMVELREAERLAHEMESYLGAIRDRRTVLSSSGFEALVEGANALDLVIAARRARATIPPVDQQIARLSAAGGKEPASAAVTPPTPSASVSVARWKVTFTPSADLVARGIKVDTIRARLADAGQLESVAPRVTPDGGISFEFIVAAADERAFAAWSGDGVAFESLAVSASPIAAAATGGALRPADTAAAVSNFVRVDLARLDDLMRLVGDLVVSRARLEDTLLRVEHFMPSSEWRTLQEETEIIERHLRDLREGVMRVRLVPIAEIFRRMPFVVRDLARDGSKRIQVDLAGHGTEIDKFLIERMMDPVLHLVRNAVSHGIETARSSAPPPGSGRKARSGLPRRRSANR